MLLKKKKSLKLLVATVIPICLLAYLSGLITKSSVNGWYKTLIKPPLTPPNITFPIVWSILYVLIGMSLWQLYLAKANKHMPNKPIVYFYIQFALNLLWTPAFFGMHSTGLGLIVILPLWLMVWLTIQSSYKYSKTAAYLLVPYYIWVTFAVYLNWQLFVLN